MSSTFKLHSNINEVTPWNAQYSFPTQSSKVSKQCVKLVPKNAASFTRTQKIRIEFPAENYLNVLNSVLLLDITTTVTARFDSPMNLTGASLSSPKRWAGIATVDDTAAAAGDNQPIATTAPFWPTTGTGLYNSSGGDLVGCIAVLYRTATPTEKYYNVITRHLNTGTESSRADFTFAYDWPITPSGNGTWSLAIYPNVSFQRGGAHNLFSRVEVKYGSITIEDIQDYARLVRMLYEVGVQHDYASSHGEILDGMSSSKITQQGCTRTSVVGGDYAGSAVRTDETVTNTTLIADSSISGLLLAPGRPRTFALNLMTGLLTQKKLIPLKWLASQLVIELTVANEGDALLAFGGNTTIMANTGTGPWTYAVGSAPRTTVGSVSYTLSNVSYLAELLNFDSSFDTAFYAALQSMGIPIKFASWHQHVFAYNSGNAIYQIHERSRSVKAAFAVSCNSVGGTVAFDRDVFFFDQGHYNDQQGLLLQNGAAPISEFWWRIGGRYFPSQPVRCYNGAPEAFIELSKALDNLGDYTRGSQISARRWAGHYTDDNQTQSEVGGEAFIMACGFENTDVMPGTIAGINAEEQSDIALNIKTRGGVVPYNKTLAIFMYYDCVMVVQAANNVVLLM